MASVLQDLGLDPLSVWGGVGGVCVCVCVFEDHSVNHPNNQRLHWLTGWGKRR